MMKIVEYIIELYNDYKGNRDKNYADKLNDTSDYMQYNAKLRKAMQNAI